MANLKVGDKAKIIQGYWAGHTGVITEVTEANYVDGTEASCKIKTEEKPFGLEFRESLLEKVEDTSSMGFFETILDAHTQHLESGEVMLEMATVKWGFMSIKLAIYGNEGTGYPHFHFFKNLKPEGGIPESARNGGGCLCIEGAKYFIHGNHSETLEPKEIKALIAFLKEKNRTFTSVTNWEYIIGQWNDNNPDRKQIPMTTKIPDYKSDMGTVQDKNKK